MNSQHLRLKWYFEKLDKNAPWFLSSTAPHGRDLLSQAGGTIFHPRPELWKLWCGPWGGTAHSFRSLKRGCWEPIQSSLNEETVHLEVETFYFMVRRSPARPSSLPYWYSAIVPASPTLHRVDPLHLEGLCGGDIHLLRLSWWTVSGQTPPGYTFPLWCTEAKAPSTVSYPFMRPGCGVVSSL